MSEAIPRPLCYLDGCSNEATCVGRYEGVEAVMFVCDEHCAHGNEDGWCVPIAEALPHLATMLTASLAHTELEAAEAESLAEQLNEVNCCHCAVALGPGSDTNSDIWCDDCAAGATAADLIRVNGELREVRLILEQTREKLAQSMAAVAVLRLEGPACVERLRGYEKRGELASLVDSLIIDVTAGVELRTMRECLLHIGTRPPLPVDTELFELVAELRRQAIELGPNAYRRDWSDLLKRLAGDPPPPWLRGAP